MEAWLRHDKTLMVDAALRQHRLRWSDIVTYALLPTPFSPYKRARVPFGPWRYSRYELRLFIVTTDGVREMISKLDFENAEMSDQERHNFRFDAVSSIRVALHNKRSHSLELCLMNGPVRTIRITDPGTGDGMEQVADDVDEDFLARVNLDAAEFTHTLRLLEGIAADGKAWIARQTDERGTEQGTGG